MPESDESSSDGDYYGPALPPNFKKAEPALEPHNRPPGQGAIIGPALPPQMSQPSSSSTPNTAPLIKDQGPVQIGPALPPGMRIGTDVEDTRNPALIEPPPQPEFEEDSSDSDSDIIGPLPPDHPKALARQAHSSERPTRSEKPAKKLQREEWMLIPPRNKPVTELGLGPRKFLSRAPEEPVKEGEDVDSDEEFERRTRAAMDQAIIDEYDKSMEAMKDKVGGGKRKKDSLLEIHQRELKKKKEEAPEKKERRPFDRDVDLSVSKLSGADRQKYIEKSRELDTRFQKGRQKFL